jgi:hypothetical protein
MSVDQAYLHPSEFEHLLLGELGQCLVFVVALDVVENRGK